MIIEDGAEPVVRLERWSGPWADDDPDANFKADVAAYSQTDPLLTVRNLARNLNLPVGAVVRYVLARWASAGSEVLLAAGPHQIERMAEIVAAAEHDGTDEARLRAYEELRLAVEWLAHGLHAAETTYPHGGGEVVDPGRS